MPDKTSKGAASASDKKPKVQAPASDKAQKAADKAQREAQRAAAAKAPKSTEPSPARTQPARLKEQYRKDVVPALIKEFGYTSVMQVPRIQKIVVNMGVGEAVADKKVLENAVADMQKITGQKPVVTKARKAIAGFKIREGYPIGCMVTLRQERMFEFLDRLVSIALPRVRDFRGVSGKGFDGRGNYNMGVKEPVSYTHLTLPTN